MKKGELGDPRRTLSGGPASEEKMKEINQKPKAMLCSLLEDSAVFVSPKNNITYTCLTLSCAHEMLPHIEQDF